MADNKKQDDFDIDSMFDNEDPPKGVKPAGPSNTPIVSESLLNEIDGFEFDDTVAGDAGGADDGDAGVGDVDTGAADGIDERPDERVPTRKRSFVDFEPDMDTILITAQSPMIIEGLRRYIKKDFSSATLSVFREAIRGIELYMKILDRNPDNYHKLKNIIDADLDCQEVEQTGFNLFKRIHKHLPETYAEKFEAFEMLRNLIAKALDRSLISDSLVKMKKYYLLSGTIDIDKISACIQNNDLEFKTFVNQLNPQINTAMDMLKRGGSEYAKGVSGKNISIFIIKGTDLLADYYARMGNRQLSENYSRINANYKKYFVIRD